MRHVVPIPDASAARKHIIAALVVNQPGCLAHIANLFAARGYNIDSLVVGRTEHPEMSRMTVVMYASLERVEQVSSLLCVFVHAVQGFLQKSRFLSSEQGETSVRRSCHCSCGEHFDVGGFFISFIYS
jgi:hypothetical protein